MLGIDPDPFTLSQLMEMAEAQWEPTARLLSLLASINRDPKKKRSPYSAADFNPFSKPSEYKGSGVSINKLTLQAVAESITGKKLADVKPRVVNLPEIVFEAA